MLIACSKLVDNLGQAVRRQLLMMACCHLLAGLLQDARFLRVLTNSKKMIKMCYISPRFSVVMAGTVEPVLKWGGGGRTALFHAGRLNFIR